MRTVRFQDWDCVVKMDKYTNGRPAISLIDANDGGSVSRATVNLPNEVVAANHVFIKDYSENAGMMQALTDAGVVKDTGVKVKCGYTEVSVAELLPPYRED